MINFGERVAYWYMRLNGFLMVENFVLHREGRRNTAETDLLAVRLRHSSETIDGVRLELHSPIQVLIGAPSQHAAIVVQVKTGIERGADAAFDATRLRRSLAFIGAVSEASLDEIVERLADAPTASLDGWTFAKLLIAEHPRERSTLCVSLNDALTFVESRLRAFACRKSNDRLFFPDELIQFLAWKAGVDG
jgi:hypothetical protein